MPRPLSYIDTDIIIRFLTGDDLEKQQAAQSLFTRVSSVRSPLQPRIR